MSEERASYKVPLTPTQGKPLVQRLLEDLTLDHIIPESHGGHTTAENLQTLCRSCNSHKGRKDQGVQSQ